MKSLELSPQHRACRKLLPWYVNGTLNASERSRVERHLEECAECRKELASLEELQECVQETLPKPETDVSGFSRVMARIDAESAPRFRTPLTVRWALAAQAAAILILAALLIWPSEPQEFRTLSDPSVEAGNGASLRVVFNETATEAELRRLLRSVEAEITGGPSAVGAYTIRADGERQELLARLRSDALVRLAEPVAD